MQESRLKQAVSTTEGGGRTNERTYRQLKNNVLTTDLRDNNIPMECNMRQPKQEKGLELKY